jgi:hypothetical protein
MHMTSRNPSSAVAGMLLASSLIFSAAAPAAAQTAEQGQNEQLKTDWSEQKLEAFAAASVAISEKQAEWRKRIADAESRDKQADLREQANKEIKGTIEDKGLSPQEYSRIHRSAQQNDDLYEELMTRIQAKRSD